MTIMKKLFLLVICFTINALTHAAEFEVFKSPVCGCCQKWVDALEEAGHTVTVHNQDPEQLNITKLNSGLPAHLGACHTAFVDGYIVEGHVPLEAIDELLETKPDIKGIAVPGMPFESLGMEVGKEAEPYVVQGFDEEGNVTPLSIYKGTEKVN